MATLCCRPVLPSLPPGEEDPLASPTWLSPRRGGWGGGSGGAEVVPWPAATAVVAEPPGRYNKPPEVSEAVLPNLYPCGVKRGDGGGLGGWQEPGPLPLDSRIYQGG